MLLWQQVLIFVAVTSFCQSEASGDCAPGETRCADARCARGDACDGTLDCGDGSDEALSLCRGTQRPLLGLMLQCAQPWGQVQELVCPPACHHLPQYCYYAISAEHGAPGTCVLPPWPQHGNYSVVDIQPRGAGPADFSLEFSCQPGHTLLGGQPRCSNGNWTTGFPTCQPPNTCQLPPYPPHGSYVVADAPEARPGQFRPGLHLTVACDPGFEVVGDRTGSCVFGAWLKSVPRCNPIKSCSQDGVQGACTRLGQCALLLNNPTSQWWRSNICGYDGIEPIICCVKTPSNSGPAPTEAAPDFQDEVAPDQDLCPELPSNITLRRTGRPSMDSAIRYQHELVYPCVRSAALDGSIVREDRCHHSTEERLIPGLRNAMRDEFPHMVLLGYGQINGSAVWQCGGTLISDRFILTAAHCLSMPDFGPVTYAIVGSLKRTDNVLSSQVYRASRVYAHPMYHKLVRDHDIALIETDTPIKLGRSAVPACLDMFGGNRTMAVATGWGAISQFGTMSDTLHKVTLTRFKDEECAEQYPFSRRGGFNRFTQLCYGNYEVAADTCMGDSGGPLTIRNQQLRCMYTVIGITSYGKACGMLGVPGVYTKVEYYVPWIESIVWPSQIEDGDLQSSTEQELIIIR